MCGWERKTMGQKLSCCGKMAIASVITYFVLPWVGPYVIPGYSYIETVGSVAKYGAVFGVGGGVISYFWLRNSNPEAANYIAAVGHQVKWVGEDFAKAGYKEMTTDGRYAHQQPQTPQSPGMLAQASQFVVDAAQGYVSPTQIPAAGAQAAAATMPYQATPPTMQTANQTYQPAAYQVATPGVMQSAQQTQGAPAAPYTQQQIQLSRPLSSTPSNRPKLSRPLSSNRSKVP